MEFVCGLLYLLVLDVAEIMFCGSCIHHAVSYVKG